MARRLCHSVPMRFPCLALLLTLAAPARADGPDIVQASALQSAANYWQIDVTLTHPDSGWDHFASAWEVLAPDGSSLGLRELAHPHVEEQPFTRSLAGIAIPADLEFVLIRARCNLGGWGMEKYRIDLIR